jgi:predicted N-acetyltransferase YhbS
MYKRGDQPPTGWCTAKVAKRRLGEISDGKLREFVKRGDIERKQFPGNKIGFYKIEDITNLLAKWDAESIEAEAPDLPGAHFMPATKEDMPEIVELLINTFGGGDTSAKRNAWIESNPESVFIVRSHGRVVGHIAILPLEEEKILNLLGQERAYSTGIIGEGDVRPFKIGEPTNLFLLSMCSDDSGISKTNKVKWGSALVRGFIDHVKSLGARGIPIRMIAARSDTKDGIRLLRKMGFCELEPNGSNRNFTIKVMKSGTNLAMWHKQALAQWEQSQNSKEA